MEIKSYTLSPQERSLAERARQKVALIQMNDLERQQALKRPVNIVLLGANEVEKTEKKSLQEILTDLKKKIYEAVNNIGKDNLGKDSDNMVKLSSALGINAPKEFKQVLEPLVKNLRLENDRDLKRAEQLLKEFYEKKVLSVKPGQAVTLTEQDLKGFLEKNGLKVIQKKNERDQNLAISVRAREAGKLEVKMITKNGQTINVTNIYLDGKMQSKDQSVKNSTQKSQEILYSSPVIPSPERNKNVLSI